MYIHFLRKNKKSCHGTLKIQSFKVNLLLATCWLKALGKKNWSGLHNIMREDPVVLLSSI